MFDRIKTFLNQPVLGTGPKVDRESTASVPAWAKASGFKFEPRGSDGFVLQGEYEKHPWTIEVGPSTRDFIIGRQLSGSMAIQANPKVAVVVMSRALKDSLDELVFKLYTDSVQTMASTDMPDEMRWVTVFDEFGWQGPPLELWQRYSIMADKRKNAVALMDEQLSRALMARVEPAEGRAAPFTLNMFRGQLMLCTGYQPASLETVQFALGVLLTACESAELELPVKG